MENYILKGGRVVKKHYLGKVTILALSSIILLSTLASASEDNIVKGQGVVMNIDFKRHHMIVNERIYIWNQSTSVYNDKGSLVTIDKIQPKSWVYIEGKRNNSHDTLAEKIYLLPKYINKSEKHLYPFME
jgi:uncharacterized membrane protein